MRIIKVRRVVVIFYMFLLQIDHAVGANELSPEFIAGIEELNNELKIIKHASLIKKINALESLMMTHQNSRILQDLIAQVLASEYAKAGEYKLASIVKLDTHLRKDEIDLSDYIVVGAVDYLSEIAGDFDIIMINEAHHLPQHRVLTIEMLDNLWSLGYRYLALEALPFEETDYSNSEVSAKGGYIDEPIFRKMLRHADKKGFKLISYDGLAQNGVSELGVELREVQGASQIYDKVFKKDRRAKVIIHCGYGHINEKIMLGSKLRSILGIDILTVSQTDRIEQFDSSVQHPTYTEAEELFNMDKPYVLMPKKAGGAWSSSPAAFDVSVFWPKAQFTNNRPNWARLSRSFLPVDIGLCEGFFPCMFELFPSTDFSLTPSDRVLIKHSNDEKYLFANCDDKYINITTLDKENQPRHKKIENSIACSG